MGRALKMRDLDPRDGSALYRTEPPFMGCEWVATQTHLGIPSSSVGFWQSSPAGEKLAGMTNVADTSDDGIAFKAFGYVVVAAPREEPPR